SDHVLNASRFAACQVMRACNTPAQAAPGGHKCRGEAAVHMPLEARSHAQKDLFTSSRCPVLYGSDDGSKYRPAGAACNHVGDDSRRRQVSGLRGRHHRRHPSRNDLAQNPAPHEPAYDISDRSEIEIGRCLARTHTTECTGGEVNQNLFHHCPPDELVKCRPLSAAMEFPCRLPRWFAQTFKTRDNRFRLQTRLWRPAKRP